MDQKRKRRGNLTVRVELGRFQKKMKVGINLRSDLGLGNRQRNQENGCS